LGEIFGQLSRRHFLAGTLGALGGSTAIPRIASAAPSLGPKRFVLITLDTLRADHLSFMGYPRQTSPFLDTLASQSAVFTDCKAASSHTACSHASLFTGCHVPQHRHWYNASTHLDARACLLWTSFRKAGYDCAGFSAVAWLDTLMQGMTKQSLYDLSTPPPGQPKEVNVSAPPYVPAQTQVDRAIAWLEAKSPEDRFALWVHLYDPHAPYAPPDAHLKTAAPSSMVEREEAYRHWRDEQKKIVMRGKHIEFIERNLRYDAEIIYADYELERLWRFFREHALAQDSVWAITADHGEGLGTHHYLWHGQQLYEEQLHVPLIWCSPDGLIEPRRVDAPVMAVDVAPTVAELFQLPPLSSESVQEGQSLVPLIRGEGTIPRRPLFAQRRRRHHQDHSRHWKPDPVFAYYEPPLKLISKSYSVEVFDLERDPHEEEDMSLRDAHVTKRLVAAASAFYDAIAPQNLDDEPAGIDMEHEENLRALGYL